MSNQPIRWLITPATSGDGSTLAKFNRLLAHETESIDLDEAVVASGVRRGLQLAPEVRYLVARAIPGGPAVGQLMLTREWSDWRDGWIWWIQSVYVDQSCRRQGMMRALFDEVLRMAKNPECDGGAVLVRLYVEEHNTQAQEFYRQVGMAPEGYQVWACRTR